jgi:hypothetical protein
MLKLAISTLVAASATTVLAAPALGDPGTTGGLPASEPPALSPQGGVSAPGGTSQPPAEATAPEPEAAQTGESPGEPPPATAPTAPDPPTDEGDSTGEPPPGQPSPQPSPGAAPAASRAGSGGSSGGGLPSTGFALASLIALGTGFVLTGYALRYSRMLDG